MDYPVPKKTLDRAQATLPHNLDGGGNAVPYTPGNPLAPYFPRPIDAVAAAMTRPANTMPDAAGDSVRASQ
jgi:hypothetical protein